MPNCSFRFCLVCIDVVFIFHFDFLYSFSILKSCTHFLFPSIFFFVWYHFLLYLPLHFFILWQPPPIERERERERERDLWFDKSVIMEPTYLTFFLRKYYYIHFQENKNTKKLYLVFVFKSFFFYILKIKNKNWIQIQIHTSFLEMGRIKNWN